MSRGRIRPEVYVRAVAAMPDFNPPFKWEFDPCASGDRIRAFHKGKGEVLAVYSDGRWDVGDPDPGVYRYAASGKECSLIKGMKRAAGVAQALGWTV